MTDPICALLYGHWKDQTRLGALPVRPADRAAAYRIQAGIEDFSTALLFGWKIAATSLAGQKHIGVDGPMAGRLLAERRVPDGGATPLGNNLMRVAEMEFAFRMAQDLPPRPQPYAQDEVLAQVSALHPAIEIPDSRYNDFVTAGEAQLIADNACAHRYVIGAATSFDWRALDLAAHKVRALRNDAVAEDGTGANVLGDPRIALTWLANELSRLDLILKAGQVVMTGTCVKPLAIAVGDRIAGDFGVLGTVSVTIA
ncbi:MAG: Hydratase [Alphaproteobacteria bacterium]|nr:Hydratase [Alphaproteobacteria bacterium]MDB5739126.1 Hydratase [Alphaproteobacteria bacterium]